MTEYRYGALYVVEQAPDHSEITKELRGIDPRLFLEQQITLDGTPVWCVVVNVGGDTPPITIHEWRDPRGEPLPLSSGIINDVRKFERDGAKLAARVIKHNRDLIESRKERSRREYEELQADMLPRMTGQRSAVLPRSTALRMSRDKRRAGGEKV